jgi:hypothetical protein
LPADVHPPLRLFLPQRYRKHVLCQKKVFPFGDIVVRSLSHPLRYQQHLKKQIPKRSVSVYTPPTTSRSTTAEDGRYKSILSPISQRSKPSRKFRQQISRRYHSLLSSDLSLGQVSTLTRRMSPADNCSRYTTDPIHRRPRSAAEQRDEQSALAGCEPGAGRRYG